MAHHCLAKIFPFERLVNETTYIGMDMEEEGKTTFYSLFTETAKDDLKNQRFTSYMHLVFQQKKKSWHISPGRVSDMGFSFEKMT